jgi:RNA polymerase sigma-70 factor (ECF subfamily)
MITPMAEPEEDSLPTSPTLLERLANPGDSRSWQEFYDRYRKLISGFAMKAGLTEDEAEEVVQETFISAFKNLPKFRYNPKVCTFRTWLLNLSNWRVMDQLRKRRAPSAPRAGGRQREETDGGARTATIERVPEDSGPELAAGCDKEYSVKLLHHALAEVKRKVEPKRWQIFDLYVFKEWTVKEVAKNLGVSAAQVYLTKHRVSKLLEQEITRMERKTLGLRSH